MIGIYKFTNKITGESYIGQSSNIKRRYNEHKNRYDSYNGNKPKEDTYFHQMLRHYGFDNFDFEVLEECKKEELNGKEIFYIEKYNAAYPKGYNKTVGGNKPHTIGLKDLQTVEEIQELLKTSKLSNIEIGEIYGVSDQTICDINSGRTWYNENISYPIRDIQHINLKIHKCKHCGKEIKYKNKNMSCRDCYYKYHYRPKIKSDITNKPTKEILYSLLVKYSFTQVGKIYGVTDNAIRKWCDKYGIPKHSSYYKRLSA